MKKHLRKSVTVLLSLIAALSFALTGCGAQNDAAYDSVATTSTSSVASSNGNYKAEMDVTEGYAVEKKADAEAALETADGAAADTNSTNSVLAEQKIILYLDYEIETLEFERSVTALESLCTQLGGYIQDSYRSGDSINYDNLHHASYTLRVPSSRLDDFKLGAEAIGTVTSISTSSENITEKYYDIESRLKSLRTQEERLLALMEKSETLTDVIELEQALAEVTYEIESLTGSLRRYDSLVNYSTITVYLNEVVKYSEPVEVPRTLWDRMGSRFMSTIDGMIEFGQDLLVLIVGLSPVLILLAVLFCVIFFPLRAVLRRAKKKNSVPSAPAAPAQGWSYSQTGKPDASSSEKPEE